MTALISGILVMSSLFQISVSVRRILLSEWSKVPTYGYGIHEYHTDSENTYLVVEGKKIKMHIFGEHNMKNINAALNVCRQIGISDEQFYEAMSSFKGASRRLELLCENKEKNNLVFRDFAHAPSKVVATVKALREQYRDRHLMVVFELHTYSREPACCW